MHVDYEYFLIGRHGIFFIREGAPNGTLMESLLHTISRIYITSIDLVPTLIIHLSTYELSTNITGVIHIR
jgi:hypothetical protein